MKASRCLPVMSILATCSIWMPGTASTECERAITTVEMVECEQARFRACREDAESLGIQLKRSLSANQVERFVASVYAWETYSYLACVSESSLYEGGSMEPLVFQACRADLECARVEWLRQAFRETLRKMPAQPEDRRGAPVPRGGPSGNAGG